MSHIQGPQEHLDNESKAESQISRRALRVNKFTSRRFLFELSSFAEEFRISDNEAVRPTPQANLGIGPVKYDIKFYAGRAVHEGRLKALDKAVRLEKLIGDELIKLDSSIVCAGYNREDPEKWVPAALRVGIRIETSNMTSKMVDDVGLAIRKDTEWRSKNQLICHLAEIGRGPNKFELTFVNASDRRAFPPPILPYQPEKLFYFESRILQRKKQNAYVIKSRDFMKYLIENAPAFKLQMVTKEKSEQRVEADDKKPRNFVVFDD